MPAPAFFGHACCSSEQDTGCINVVDFDMALTHDGKPGPDIRRALIKAVNLTPYNYLKHGMNLTSLEAIFARDEEERKAALEETYRLRGSGGV